MEEIEEAMALVESGNVSEGLTMLEKIEQGADDDDKYKIAQLYYEWGHLGKAKPIVENLRALYPDENELAFLLAEILIDADDEEQAIEVLTDVRSEDADHLRALLLLADIYTAQGLDEVAEQKLLEAKRMAPEEPVVAFALAEYYFMFGDFKKSVPHYEQVLRDGGIPGENANLKLAEALSGSGEFEKALTHFETENLGEIEPHALFSFGFTAFQAGESQQAIQIFSALKEQDPDYSKLYLYLTRAFRSEGRMEEAFQTAEEGLRVDSFNDELAYEAGDAALTDGRVQEAEQFLQKVLDINSIHHDALKLLAGLFSRQERYDEVISLLASIDDSEEQDPVFAWYLATAEREEEQFEKAHSHYEKAYRAFSEDPAFLEEYGDFLLEEGRRSDAVSMFKKALAEDSSLIHLEEKILHFEE
ncbi:MAG TPA: tetratricopeptide repeat protein [Bacillales bacterium]|nr:tetratricopeptide repeat protein [Bacillales bacterium]